MLGPTGSNSGSIRAMARSAVLAASDWRARLSITPTRTVAPAVAAWCDDAGEVGGARTRAEPVIRETRTGLPKTAKADLTMLVFLQHIDRRIPIPSACDADTSP